MTDWIHELLNEPEMIKILDKIEVILYFIFATLLTVAYMAERMNKTSAGTISIIAAIGTGSLFALLFFLRRPIQRNQGGGE